MSKRREPVVHFMVGYITYACGYTRGNSNRFTCSHGETTCRNCRRTKAWKEASNANPE